MGLLARRWEERNVLSWLNDDDYDHAGMSTPSGVRVDQKTALGVTTFWRCVDLLTSAVSQAPKDIVVKIGTSSFPEFSKPSWLVNPDPGDPTYTVNDYFSEVAFSLLVDGNYFVAPIPYVLDPQALRVLDPRRVRVRPGPKYDILDEYGAVITTLGPWEILHGWWVRPPGALRGISPLETLRRSIGSAVAAEEFGGRFFGQGASLSFGVETPGALTDPQKEELRNQLKRKYAGLGNSHAIGVLTSGAKFVTGLAPTPEQAQMLDTRKFGVEDICRPFGVPPNMAGSQEPGASSYASADVWRDEFRDYAVLPLATRIEAQHNRMLLVPSGITAPNASIQFKFNLDAVARTNVVNRATASEAYVRSGIKTPNEARAKEDLPPLPGGDRLYMQQQMVALGDPTRAPEPA